MTEGCGFAWTATGARLHWSRNAFPNCFTTVTREKVHPVPSATQLDRSPATIAANHPGRLLLCNVVMNPFLPIRMSQASETGILGPPLGYGTAMSIMASDASGAPDGGGIAPPGSTGGEVRQLDDTR